MFSAIRKGMNNILVLILMGLLIASFAIWGIGDIFTQRAYVIASVGDEDIEADEILRQFQNQVASYRAQFGGQFTDQQAISLGLHRIVIQQAIARTLFDQKVKAMGLRATDQQVLNDIQDTEAFQTEAGDFSPFIYRQALAGAGLLPSEYESALRDDLARTQMIDALQAASPIPDAMVDTLFRFRKETRTASMLRIAADTIENIAEPDEETLRTYWENNQNQFMTPEYRNLSFVVLDPADFAADLELDEEALRQAYEARIGQYSTPEIREVDVAVVQDEETANRIYERVQAGESFANVAFDETGFTEEDIALGDMTALDMETDYNEVAAERVFSAEENSVVQPVQTLFGWNVFYVKAITPGDETPFEEVRDELENQIRTDTGIDQMFDITANIDDAIAAGYDLEGVAEQAGVPLIHLPRVDSRGLNPDGTLADNAAAALPYIRHGFALEVLEPLELFETEGEGYYLVQVNEVFPPEVQPFEEVRDAVRNAWMNSERISIAGDRAQSALEALENGGDMDIIAAGNNATVVETGPLVRDQNGRDQGIAANIASLIFSLPEGGYGMERASASGAGYVIVRVDSIAEGNPDADSSGRRIMRSQLRQAIESDLLQVFQTAAIEDIEVTINESLVDQIFTPEGIVLPTVTSSSQGIPAGF